jgi:hypothetical protein
MLKTYQITVRDIKLRTPLFLSLNTKIVLTFNSSAAVTLVPLGRVKLLVVPFIVKVIGRVAVASDGITSEITIVKYPTGYILRNPSAKSIVSVPTVVLVVTIYGTPPAFVAKI